MTFTEIARTIGKKIWLREVAYQLITLTTLREWYIRRTLARYLPVSHDFDFLDAGSGIGQHAIRIGRSCPGARVTAVERDRRQVEDCIHYVKRIGLANVSFHCSDLGNFTLRSQFDVILCASVLEHLRDDLEQLKTFHHHLKKGGILVLYTPASEQRVLAPLARSQNRRLRQGGDSLPHQHLRYYSAAGLRDLTLRAGFEPVEVEITYGRFGRYAYDIVTLVQYSRLFRLLFPFYLVMVHPFVLILMWADYVKNNSEGNGVLLVARKSV